MEHHDSQAQEREIRRLQQEVLEAKMRSMVVESRLRQALKAVEMQAETLEHVTQNVLLILTTIRSEIDPA